MADRKSVVQVTTRFRKDLYRRLVREAKARDISMSQEIERRLESSFGFESWRAERGILLSALKVVLLANPSAKEAYATALAAVNKLESYGEGVGGRENWMSRAVNIPPATAGETESEDDLPSTGKVGRPQHHRADK